MGINRDDLDLQLALQGIGVREHIADQVTDMDQALDALLELNEDSELGDVHDLGLERLA